MARRAEAALEAAMEVLSPMPGKEPKEKPALSRTATVASVPAPALVSTPAPAPTPASAPARQPVPAPAGSSSPERKLSRRLRRAMELEARKKAKKSLLGSAR
jgi:hypothetical protein